MKKKQKESQAISYKEISTPTGILVVLLVAVVAGVLVWQFLPEVVPSPSSTISPNPSPTPTLSPSPTSTPRADEMADWEVYRSDEYGFEVKYPEEWHIAEKRFSIGSCAAHLLFSADKDKNYEFYPWSRNINIEIWYSHESDETIAHSGVMGMITENKNSDLKIDGKQTKEFICGIADQVYDTGIHDEHKFIVRTDNFAYAFWGTVSWDKKDLIYDEILSTFKFID
ncbi:MAG: hypothetical protein U9Q96_00365 [Patescibacteria group bacterium]|nr:hypothetical protein [Patescibacteria group bacterium]